ncbi:Predicted haloacid-halidohydrolase and related hydrolases [Ceraceosorus bombacis]|uniref:Predicted haloacid-halidohydrolase and related hydrolases n=1 Tax=Ceraceosorus bombacis TaxID=401625 RepID=A0A0P1B8L0_9BASI|nr:Predicted haloacid-halidohydrolase and related hydrolases [Ceraceosorus bombacis]
MSSTTPSPEANAALEISCDVHTVLFDMDGTLIDSTPAVNATWRETCDRFGLDYDEVLKTCHGWRTIENLARFVPSIPAADMPKEVTIFEGRISEIAQDCLDGKRQDGRIDAMPGAKELLRDISAGRSESPTRRAGWAIVTSATAAYAHVGFASSRVSAPPEIFITGDICARGKPDPFPYLLGAEKALAPPQQCVVVEDAPAGVRSGKASGARVLGLCTTHSERSMWEAGADWVVQDLRDVSAKWQGDGPAAKLTLKIASKAAPTDVTQTTGGKA